jgi:hypothetical protein
MNLFKRTATVVFLALSVLTASAQDKPDSTQIKPVTEKDNRPVKDIFGSGLMFDQQTVRQPLPGSFEILIQHRFGTIKNGVQDLFGIYSSSNVRLGVNWAVAKYLTLGFGTTRYYKLQDFNWKVALLTQKRSGSMPFSLSYYGNVVIDARTKDNFGPPETYKFTHRLSFFNQLMIARKFSNALSLQAAASMSNFNAVSSGYDNIKYDLTFTGKYKIASKINLIGGYDLPILQSEAPEIFKPKSNLSFGIEIGSPTHTFEIFVANSDYLVNQYGLAYNTNTFKNSGLLVGLNITVRF